MKKRILLLTLLICCLFSLTAFADVQLPYVTDEAGLLSETERSALEREAQFYSDRYNCGLYIIALPDHRLVYDGDAFDCAQYLYQSYDLGLGAEKNGMLLLLSMKEGDFAVAAYGMLAHTAFTDYGKELLIDEFTAPLEENDWFGGFGSYLTYSAYLLEQAEAGTPVDIPSVELSAGEKAFFVVGISSLVALVVCLIFCFQMKTARKQTHASAYVVKNSFHLDRSQDIFLYRSETRTPIVRDTGSSGGGGTTINSSGFSGRSGKF